MSETRDVRLKRLRMRSMRRGIKEMDLILSAFAETELDKLDEAGLDLYERLLSENDQEIYSWITGQEQVAPDYAGLLEAITRNFQK